MALIGVPAMLSATQKSKESAVKANFSSLSTTIVAYQAIGGKDTITGTTDAITDLNNPDGSSGTDDEDKSPFDNSLQAFVDGSSGGSGQVIAVSSSTKLI